jgi:hypothetical protein
LIDSADWEMASSQRRNRNRFKTTSSCDGYSCITGYFLSLVDTRDDDADTDDEEDADIDDGELNADVSDENVFSGSALNASSKELKKLTGLTSVSFCLSVVLR